MAEKKVPVVSFNDRHGKAWSLPEIDFAWCLKAKRELGINFMKNRPDAADPKNPTAEEMEAWWYGQMFDREKLGSVLIFLFEPLIKEKNWTDEDFAAHFDIPSLDDARNAVIEGAVSFLRSPAIGKSIRQQLTAGMANVEKQIIESISNNDVGN